MDDSDDVELLMEFRQTYSDLWEQFLKDKNKLAEWKKKYKVGE